jgi:hypothetical protein
MDPDYPLIIPVFGFGMLAVALRDCGTAKVAICSQRSWVLCALRKR